MQENHPDRINNSPPASISTRRLWLGFLLSPAAWAIYFVLIFVIDETACNLSILSPSSVLPLATIFGLITLGVIAFAARYAYQARQGNDDQESSGFMGRTGLLLCGLFGLSTIAVWVSALVLMPC